MGQFYWKEMMDEEYTSFELFVRSLPKSRSYLIAAGLGTALWHLRRWRFSGPEIDFLRSQTDQAGTHIYEKHYLDYLRDLDFTCDVWAMREGTPIGAQVPILRVTGPRIQCTLIESLLLSIINHQTMIASKAARIVTAARGRQVWDFSLRRLHGPEASLGVARAAYIAGAAGTATVEAGRILKIPLTGTMAHAQVMAYGEAREQEVFERVLWQYPDNHALLVDTYDTWRGVEQAIRASINVDIPLRAIRIDSELERVASPARQQLDAAGFEDTKILASGDLDEASIDVLHKHPVDGYGVGTMLGTSADAPHLGGVYKLVEQEGDPQYVMKLTPGKQTDPGAHQVWRLFSEVTQRYEGDMLTMLDEPNPVGFGYTGVPLLTKVMEEGRILPCQPTLETSRKYCAEQLDRMPPRLLDLDHPATWTLIRSDHLWRIRAGLGDEQAMERVRELEKGRV